MMNRIMFIIFILVSNTVWAQTGNDYCRRLLSDARWLAKGGNYSKALDKLAGARVCDEQLLDTVNKMILEIYTSINNERIEADRQRQLAESRARIIASQRDSITKEYHANLAATEALQIMQIDPMRALRRIYTGLQLSPGNRQLHEVRKQIFAEQKLMIELPGSNVTVSYDIESNNDRDIFTGGADGCVTWWDMAAKKIKKRYKAFTRSVTKLALSRDGTRMFMLGNDSPDRGGRNIVFKELDLRTERVRRIENRGISKYTALEKAGKADSLFVADSLGRIWLYPGNGDTLQQVGNVGKEVIELKYWEEASKLFCATALAVKEVFNNKTLYELSPESTGMITAFGFCNATGDLYIGQGPDLIIYNYVTQQRHLAYPVHGSFITSCACSENGSGLLTTSADSYAVLWTSSGNVRSVLKGSRAEIYNGYFARDGSFAITAGSRELRGPASTDTNTVKFWLLNGHLSRKIPDAHMFGANGVEYNELLKAYITGGHDNTIKVWDENLELLMSEKFGTAGISCLATDTKTNRIAFGTFDGLVGTGQIDLQTGKITVRQSRVHTEMVRSVKIRDGKIFSAGRDGAVIIQDYNGVHLDSIYFNAEIFSINVKQAGKLLVCVGNDVALLDLKKREPVFFRHRVRVNDVEWLDRDHFVTVSGEFFRRWNTGKPQQPVTQANNHLINEMTSLYVDPETKLIYTGTHSGYIICWDREGRQVREMDQLATRADNAKINDITGNSKRIVTADYNGNLALWYRPEELEAELGLRKRIF